MQNDTPQSQLPTHNADDEINLLEYWRVLVKRKRLIGVFIIITFISSVVTSLLLPNIYISTASILPPQPAGSMSSGMVSPLPGGLGGLAGGFLGLQTPADLWVGILKSQTIKEAMVSRFNLVDVYQTDNREAARNTLGKRVIVIKSKEDIISIKVEDPDPKMAADLANAYIEELDTINRSVVMTSGRRMRTFVEDRLKDSETDLEKSENAIKDFQEENKAFQLDEQSKAIFEAIGHVRGELIAKEVELQTLLSFAAPANPQVGILKSQVESLKQRLNELEKGKGPSSHQGSFIPTSRIPNLALQYARLFREAKIQQTLYELLTQQYEMARIQEAKDSPTVQVLDTAMVPEKRSKPKRKQIVILSTFVGALLSFFLAFFFEYIERIRDTENLKPHPRPNDLS